MRATANDVRKMSGIGGATLFAAGLGCAVSHFIDAINGKFVPNFKIDPRITAALLFSAIPFYNHFVYGEKKNEGLSGDASREQVRNPARRLSWKNSRKYAAQACLTAFTAAAIALTYDSLTQLRNGKSVTNLSPKEYLTMLAALSALPANAALQKTLTPCRRKALSALSGGQKALITTTGCAQALATGSAVALGVLQTNGKPIAGDKRVEALYGIAVLSTLSAALLLPPAVNSGFPRSNPRSNNQALPEENEMHVTSRTPHRALVPAR